jgi:predicted DNA-binding protein with PD1-like motif
MSKSPLEKEMRFQKTGTNPEGYIVRLESGDPVIETLTAFMAAQGIGFASISAIGSMDRAEVGWWNGVTREYEFHLLEEQLEVLSFQGSCTVMDGKPFVHLHCMLGRHDLSVVGGHLKEGRAYPMAEVWVQTQDATVLRAPEGSFTAMQLPDKLD